MEYDFLLGRTHFSRDDGYQNSVVFASILNSQIVMKKLLIRYQPEYHWKKLNHLILTLN